MRHALLLLLATSTLASCGVRDRIRDFNHRQTFDGAYYRTNLASDRQEPQAFTVTVSNIDQGLDGARQAGDYEAIKHCIEHFGNSDIIWSASPDAPDAALTIVNGSLILKGTCKS